MKYEFKPGVKAAGSRNEMWEPYQVNGEWWFDQPHGRRGPFISEEAAMRRAGELKALWDEERG